MAPKKKKQEVKSFSKFFPKVVSEIETEAHIGKGLAGQALPDEFSAEDIGLVSTKAIWDTGATHTVISQKLADALSLIPVTFQKMTGINGTEECPVYIICLVLPNGVYVPDLSVSGVEEIGNEDQDVLIGMDIIRHGDLAISNFNNKTTFTFTIPSAREIDFVNMSSREAAPDGAKRRDRRKHQRHMNKSGQRFRK